MFNDETLTLYLSVEELSELNLEFKASFTIRLFYNNTNGSMSEVSYVNREIAYDGLTNEYTLVLKPKKALANFESYNGFEISYQIVYMGIRGEE